MQAHAKAVVLRILKIDLFHWKKGKFNIHIIFNGGMLTIYLNYLHDNSGGGVFPKHPPDGEQWNQQYNSKWVNAAAVVTNFLN